MSEPWEPTMGSSLKVGSRVHEELRQAVIDAAVEWYQAPLDKKDRQPYRAVTYLAEAVQNYLAVKEMP